MAHYNQNQKEVTKRGTSAQRRPLRGLRSIPFGNPGPSDRNHRNRQPTSPSTPSPPTPTNQRPTYARSCDSARSCPEAPMADETARPLLPARHGSPHGSEPLSRPTGWRTSATAGSSSPRPENATLLSMDPTKRLKWGKTPSRATPDHSRGRNCADHDVDSDRRPLSETTSCPMAQLATAYYPPPPAVAPKMPQIFGVA